MIYHLEIDILRLLAMNDEDLMHIIQYVETDSEIQKFQTEREVRQELMKYINQGYRLWPIGVCNNFDHVKKGCRGHEEKEFMPGM